MHMYMTSIRIDSCSCCQHKNRFFNKYWNEYFIGRKSTAFLHFDLILACIHFTLKVFFVMLDFYVYSEFSEVFILWNGAIYHLEQTYSNELYDSMKKHRFYLWAIFVLESMQPKWGYFCILIFHVIQPYYIDFNPFTDVFQCVFLIFNWEDLHCLSNNDFSKVNTPKD